MVSGLYAPSRHAEPRPTRNHPPRTPQMCLTTVQREPAMGTFCTPQYRERSGIDHTLKRTTIWSLEAPSPHPLRTRGPQANPPTRPPI